MSQPRGNCCHRPRRRFCDEMANATSHSYRLSAQTCHRQLCRRYRGGTNRSTPVWLGVVIHDALFRKRGEHFQYPFRKDKVIYGDLPFGGQDGQPGRGALRCGRFGLSELFPDAQRLRRGAARLHTQSRGLPGRRCSCRQWLPRNGRTGKNSGTPWRKRRKPRTAVWRGSSSPRCPSSCHASSRLSFCKILSGSSSWMKGCAPTLRSTTPTATIPTPTSC